MNTAQALLKQRRPAAADSDDEFGVGHDSSRKLTKFVNNQAFDQGDDDDEDISYRKKAGGQGYANNANRRDSYDSN